MTESTQSQASKLHSLLDNCGAGLSFLCGIHCLAMPFLIAFLPAIGMEFLLNETAEKVIAILAILIAGISFFWGYRIHRKAMVLVMFALGATMIFIPTFAMAHDHHHHDHHGHDAHHDGHKSEHDKHDSHKDEHEKHEGQEEKHGGHEKGHEKGHEEKHGDHHDDHEGEKIAGIEERSQGNALGLTLLVIGALFLTGGHLLNHRYCKNCAVSQDDSEVSNHS